MKQSGAEVVGVATRLFADGEVALPNLDDDLAPDTPAGSRTREMEDRVNEFEEINVKVDDGVAVVTLDRPERLNAWTARMGQELSRAFRALDGDPAVRVIVLTGAGRAFCVGADLGAGSATFDSDRPADGAAREPLVLPWQLRKPVIAAINGHAIGVGITLPLTADVRFIAEDAKVQFVFVRRGVGPELSHT